MKVEVDDFGNLCLKVDNDLSFHTYVVCQGSKK